MQYKVKWKKIYCMLSGDCNGGDKTQECACPKNRSQYKFNAIPKTAITLWLVMENNIKETKIKIEQTIEQKVIEKLQNKNKEIKQFTTMCQH